MQYRPLGRTGFNVSVAGLGTGGLSRAYSSGVKLALDALPTEPKIDRIPVAIVIGYENVTEI